MSNKFKMILSILITKTIFTIDKLGGGLMNDRGVGPVSEASDCGGAAVACGEIEVAGCENNSRRAEDVVKQHNSIEMCDAITDQQIPDAILCHF